MSEDDPKPNNPLGPYYPSEVPSIPGNGRRWAALLVAAAFVVLLFGRLLELLVVVFG